jgi:hypothetical protein
LYSADFCNREEELKNVLATSRSKVRDLELKVREMEAGGLELKRALKEATNNEYDDKIAEYRKLINLGKVPEFIEDEQGTIWFKNRICVPKIKELREAILKEAHDSAYSIHHGSTKMYQDLKQRYWWYGMKKDVAAHVALCDVCQRVKAEYQRLAGLLQPLKVPEWKWEVIGMDFIVGLPRVLLSKVFNSTRVVLMKKLYGKSDSKKHIPYRM